MITYCNKDELKATFGSATWYKLEHLNSFDGLMFDNYWYRMDGNIFGADTPAAREAFEKEKAWYLLQRTKLSDLEVMAEMSNVAEEIERVRQSRRDYEKK